MILKNRLKKAYLNILLVIITLSIIGLSTVNHYGATWDEWIEIYMVKWVREYINEGKPIERDSEYYGFIFNYTADQFYDISRNLGFFKSDQQYDNLTEYHQNNIKLRRKIQVKHIFTFIFSLLTYISVAGIVAILTSWEYGWFAPIVLALFPQFWGHSFFNPKDIPFAAMFTLAVWAGACLLNYYYQIDSKHQKIGRNKITLYSLLYGSLVGLVTGVRVGGFLMIFFLLAAHLLTQLNPKIIFHKISNFFKFYLLIIVAWFLITTLTYPASWSNPFQWFFEAIENFSKYSLWDNSVLFDGQFIPGKSLPWYYLPRLLNITIPLIFQITFLIGIIGIIIKYRNWSETKRACAILVLLQLFFIPTVAIIKQSTIYDGIRHFLFIIPPIAVISTLGFIWLYQNLKNKFLKIFASTLLIIQFSLIFLDMVALHPYQYTYFNRIYGGLAAAYEQQETDYWGLSLKEGMEWLNKNAEPNSTIVVAGPTFAAEIYADPYQNFQMINRDQFDRSKAPNSYYYMAIPRYDYQQAFPECPVIYSVTRQNTPLTIIKQCQ
ncbi:hypothetical protein PCC7424_0020 [Gloeothece citriformis PCC 7424]|uniref:Glycosyltransferase RgtA/B/C/D-like domain-containing protein n=1 Tax=Gloeothece citriformis (strain PCC 7424) TaxID=65393 RepID=B7K806_GLOC7|nr:hypothetical protein [Gloeothece citriformis]ACK68494.1 hypothetical protein PCC7424_0020 [Gloeothece citriformis PCC 7424]